LVALSRQLGQRYVVSSFKKKEIEEQKENLLPDFDKVLPNPLIAPVPRAQIQKPEETPLVVEEVEDEIQKIVDEIQKDIEEWIERRVVHLTISQIKRPQRQLPQ
jgi:hypothetical protein